MNSGNGNVSADDRGLLSYRRFLDGDNTGLEDIVGLYSDSLLYFINGYVGNVTASEDLVSETFFRLIRKKRTFRGESSFKTYLYTIARNLSVDWLRKSGRETPTEEIESTEEESLEELVLTDERSKALGRAIKKLGDNRREIICLVYFDGLGVSEAAKVMKLSRKSAENLLYRAKQSLKHLLIADGFTENDI